MNAKLIIFRLMTALERLCGPYLMNSVLDRLFTPQNIAAAVKTFLNYTEDLAQRTSTPIDVILAKRLEEAAAALLGPPKPKKTRRRKCPKT